jgi:hypothetical protein
MVVAGTMNPPGRPRMRRLIPAMVAASIVCVGGGWLVSAVQKARNAAHAATTT